MVEGGKTPFLNYKELESMGYNIVIYPLTGWMAAASVLTRLMAELRSTGTTQDFWARRDLKMSFEELFAVFDFAKIQEAEKKFVHQE
jgi:2-methylisocitrate lyase-like PEP mutase family enzyme